MARWRGTETLAFYAVSQRVVESRSLSVSPSGCQLPRGSSYASSPNPLIPLMPEKWGATTAKRPVREFG